MDHQANLVHFLVPDLCPGCFDYLLVLSQDVRVPRRIRWLQDFNDRCGYLYNHYGALCCIPLLPVEQHQGRSCYHGCCWSVCVFTSTYCTCSLGVLCIDFASHSMVCCCQCLFIQLWNSKVCWEGNVCYGWGDLRNFHHVLDLHVWILLDHCFLNRCLTVHSCSNRSYLVLYRSKLRCSSRWSHERTLVGIQISSWVPCLWISSHCYSIDD